MDFEAVVLMSKRNHLHSFTLWPKSSMIVDSVKNGKKSQYVSRAIAWYAEPREFIVREYEYDDDSGRTYSRNVKLLDLSELVEGNANLQKRYAEVCIELRDLKESQSFISKIRNKLRL